MNTSQSISNKISKSQWVLQSIESVKYSINKWWYKIVSTTCLRKIPFIRKQRILYFERTKEMLYLIEQVMNDIKSKAKTKTDKSLKQIYNRYLNPSQNSNPKTHETEHKYTGYKSPKEHKSSCGENIYRQK